MSIYFKSHKSPKGNVLAVCDKELIGKILEENHFHFEIYESFYKGEKITPKKLKKLIHEFDNINLVGEKSVGIAISEKIASEKNVIRIKNVPHVQIFTI
ncbi:MAG: DUF424 family protein [Candidatus Diapherotrites archaeon]